MDFDTGNHTQQGEYRLTDETYAKLLDKLMKEDFAGMPTATCAGTFWLFTRTLPAPNFTKKKHDKWEKVQKELDQLKAARPTEATLQ